MKTINDGEPAFPDDRSQVGMTLRDYFAAKADIPWEVAMSHAVERLSSEGTYLGETPAEDVIKSRAILKIAEADSMLKAREAR